MKHTGSCLCGKITFEIEGDFDDFYLCHCKLCRKDTGSAHAANMFSSTAKLNWLSGEQEVKTFKYESTEHQKSFCPKCGSALPNLQMEGKLLVVPAGSLDSKIFMKPSGHLFYKYKAKWDNELEKAPKFDKFPE